MRMDIAEYRPENVLLNFHPLIRKNFEELFCEGQIGLSYITIHDFSITKRYVEDGSSYGFHYSLKIPYAGKRLFWDLIFNPEDMRFAPDFNFNDDSFHLSEDVDLVIENVPSLLSWNVQNSKSLVSVLQQFFTLYKKQQMKKLQEDNIFSRFQKDYEILINEKSYTANDIEVALDSSTIQFLIKIKTVIISLPEYLQPYVSDNDQSVIFNPGEDTAVLRVCYVKLDGSRVTTSLQLSPRLEQILGDSKTLHIPTYTKHSLPDYVQLITNLINDLIKKVEQSYKLRKEYIHCLSTLYSRKLIEFDSEIFSKGVLLCEVDGYHCLVHIDIGRRFPDEKPVVTLQSLYCMSYNKPCYEEVEDYPYSPRWPPEEMLQRLMVFLEEKILLFKMHKH